MKNYYIYIDFNGVKAYYTGDDFVLEAEHCKYFAFKSLAKQQRLRIPRKWMVKQSPHLFLHYMAEIGITKKKFTSPEGTVRSTRTSILDNEPREWRPALQLSQTEWANPRQNPYRRDLPKSDFPQVLHQRKINGACKTLTTPYVPKKNEIILSAVSAGLSASDRIIRVAPDSEFPKRQHVRSSESTDIKI